MYPTLLKISDDTVILEFPYDIEKLANTCIFTVDLPSFNRSSVILRDFSKGNTLQITSRTFPVIPGVTGKVLKVIFQCVSRKITEKKPVILQNSC